MSLRSVTVKILVVRVFTTAFNIQKFYFPPIQYIYVLLTDLRKKRLYLLRGTNGVFDIIQANFNLYKTWYDSDGSRFDPGQSCDTCVGLSGTWTGFLRVVRVSTVLINPSVLHTRFYLHVVFTRKTGGRKWEPYKLQWSFGNRRS